VADGVAGLNRTAASPSGERTNRTLALRLAVLLATSGVVLWILRSTVDETTRLFFDTVPSSPYFVPGHFVLLYLKIPAVVFASIVLLLAPGCCLALAARPGMRFFETLVKGFAISTVAHIVTTALVKLAIGPVSPGLFLAWLYGFGVVSWGLLYRIAPAGDTHPAWSRSRLIVSAVLCVAATILFLPMIFWQELTGDGAEMLFAAQSMSEFILPRWPSDLAVSTLGKGMLFQPIVPNWFVLLFGPIEPAIRLPLVLFLPVLLAALVLVIEHGVPRPLRPSELWCVASFLGVFVAALVFNATYSLYGTDPASPGGMEYATVLGIFGTIYFLWSREWVWFAAFVTMGHFSRPTELLFLLAVGVAAWMFCRPRARTLIPVAVAIISWFVFSGILSATYLAEALAITGGAQNPLNQYSFVQFWDPQRLLMIAAGGGLLPIMSVVAFRWQDLDTRVLSVAWALTFLAFYLPAAYAVHHLAPVMVLPIAIFWRTALRGELRALVPVSLAVAAVALMLTIPAGPHIVRHQRAAARSIQNEVGDVDGSYEDRREAVLAASMMSDLFPAGVWDAATELSPEPLALVYYAQRRDPAAPTYYFVRRLDDPLPNREPDATGRALLYVVDREAWEKDRFGTYSLDWRSSLYSLGPATLFVPAAVERKNYHFAPAHLPLFGRLFQNRRRRE